MLTLGRDALHGYSIMQELERRTGGRETLLPGSLHATIARMVSEGLIEEVTPAQPTAAKRRREYRATTFGREVAREEIARLQELICLASEQGLLTESR